MDISQKLEEELIQMIYDSVPIEEYTKIASMVQKYGIIMRDTGREDEKKRIIEIILEN